MTPIPTALTTLCISALSLCHLSAQDIPIFESSSKIEKIKERNDEHRISVLIEYLSVDTKTLFRLLSDDTISNSDSLLRKKIGLLEEANKAELIESAFLTCVAGGKTDSHSGKQVIYPTEYDPANITDITVDNSNKDLKKNDLKGIPFAIGPSPTAFEERPTGLICSMLADCDPTTKKVTLSLDCSLVYYQGVINWAEWKDQFGTANTSMPLFYNSAFKTTTVINNMDIALLATHTPKGDDGKPDKSKKLVVFAKVVVK